MAPHAAPDRSPDVAHPSRFSDVVDVMLDHGVIVDFYTRVVFTDLEIATVDGRVVIGSIDTYVRFAKAAGRLGTAVSGMNPTHSLAA